MRLAVPNKSATLLLGIDIGSSGVKGLLLDSENGIVDTESSGVDLYSDRPGFAEADTTQWWSALNLIISKLISNNKVNPEMIAAIAFSGMVPAVLFLDKNRKPLRRAILQNDARATAEIDEIKSQISGVDLLKLTGSSLTQQSVAPTVLWMSKNEPEILAQTHFIVGSYDWAAMALGAQPHVEENWAIESGLYNWDGTPIEVVISSTKCTWPTLLPPVAPGTFVGSISASSASELGLSPSTSIIVGGADHVLSAYGAGLVNTGDSLVKLGGAGDILVSSDKKILDPRLYLDKHPVPGKWLPNGCMATSGSLLRWGQHIFGDVDLEMLDAEAAASQPGSLLTLPYFLGEKSPLHDPSLRGVIAGLHLGSTSGDIHRSFLEAIAYGFREHSEVFASVGAPMGRTRITNGGSKSRLWREILADVMQRDLISIVNHPGASFAAAVIAGIGSGIISDWSFVNGYLEEGEVISPNNENRDLYNNRYAQYVELRVKTKTTTHALAKEQI